MILVIAFGHVLLADGLKAAIIKQVGIFAFLDMEVLHRQVYLSTSSKYPRNENWVTNLYCEY